MSLRTASARRLSDAAREAGVPTAEAVKRADTVWVEPRFEAEVAYTEITTDGMLRLPSFKGLLA